VFDLLINRDVISWTALITGYVDCGHSENALDSFRQMQREGVPPNAITGFANLKACGNVGAVNIGREIHKILAEYGLEKEPSIINLLVDMYSKFGLVLESSSIFSYLPCQEIGSWNALIAGYTHLGDAETVLHCVQKMGTQNVKPDSVTFMNVLNVCNHGGLVDMGCTVFGDINTNYSCVLILEHYTCMIDLLGRAGHIEKALLMIKEMPFIPDDATYQVALGACQKQGNLELGKGVFQHAILSDENHASAYVCMANIYAHAENG
jgi:pentatricopeptide repeat protein